MRKHRWLLLGLLLASIAGLVILVLALLPPPPGVTKENFDRIEVGMPRPEVEAIFGSGGNARAAYLPDEYEWVDQATGDAATICFDADQRVVVKNWDGWPDDRTVWQKLLDRMPWRERPPPPPRFRTITNY